MNKSIIVLLFFISLAIGASIAQIACSTAFTTAGITLSRLETQTLDVQKENAILSEKVYTQGSLSTIASQAATLGFMENKKQTIVLSAPAPLALR